MKISKKRYVQAFGVIVILLAAVRAVFPEVAEYGETRTTYAADTLTGTAPNDSRAIAPQVSGAQANPNIHGDETDISSVPYPKRYVGKLATSLFFNADGTLVRHRIYSVYNFGKSFPDQNDVQLVSAKKWGVKPVANRAEAEKRKKELVYVGCNPFFHVDRLKNSIPYLVPEASILLQDIGQCFFDSLQIKGIPLHRIIVTSVLRSKEDVAHLRGHNGNATPNSCHLYGTTFDICYNRYQTVSDPDGPMRRPVRNDSLKWVLSEVLNDMRTKNRCWVKYEVHQGCFHITVK